MSWEVLIPMLMVLLVGFPHGAADGVLAVNLARRGTIGLGAFFALYGVITLSAAAFWLWLPVLSLISFLLLSVVHFGTLDSRHDRLVGRRTLRTLVHGSTLICIIPWAHEREVTEIFGLLIRFGGRVAGPNLGCRRSGMGYRGSVARPGLWPGRSTCCRRIDCSSSRFNNFAATLGVRFIFLHRSLLAPYERNCGHAGPLRPSSISFGGFAHTGQFSASHCRGARLAGSRYRQRGYPGDLYFAGSLNCASFSPD